MRRNSEFDRNTKIVLFALSSALIFRAWWKANGEKWPDFRGKLHAPQ